jgi:type II secretory pathway pseudopilin PulG
MKKYFLKIQKKEKGFTLLFAVLLSTLIVSISASIISIALRQTILSGTSRESQYAFYAANTVLECAFYWDITNSTVFPAPEDSRISSLDPDYYNIKCAGGNIITGEEFNSSFAIEGWDISEDDQTTFYMEIKDNGSLGPGGETQCAKATVKKTVDDGVITTRIEAKGYNTCDLTHPRAVERGLVQEYQS